MLFNSAAFLFVFLPIAVSGYVLLRKRWPDAAVVWLAFASLGFYAVWKIVFLNVIVASILFNYGLALLMLRSARNARLVLVLGICANLGVLGYFKYVNFFIENISALAGIDNAWSLVVLPIGISFFTFQQIAYLVDTYRGRVKERSFARYALFISFFPQLIAGPIVHHSEMMPQFGRPRTNLSADLAAGLTLLAIGLIKKMGIADGLAIPASAVFDAAATGSRIGFQEAWIGSFCYALQIYFDFSAYSDMAIGLGRMMGIDLPINFASPYKASSIIDFWRRWHITLSRFLRDYLYIPLGGNRHGVQRQKLNVFLTMLLGGIWHGAGWTFVVWGALHGAFLLVNHIWSETRTAGRLAQWWAWRLAAHGLTLLAVVGAWVAFRAADLTSAGRVWGGMIGLNGLGRIEGREPLSGDAMPVGLIVLGVLIALFAPNAYQLLRSLRLGLPSPGYPATVIPASPVRPAWLWSPLHATAVGAGLVLVVLMLNDISQFIYFQF